MVASRARERQVLIQQQLADALDGITISIEAGLSLETAVINLVEVIGNAR